MTAQRYLVELEIKDIEDLIAARLGQITDLEVEEGTVKTEGKVIYEFAIASEIGGDELRQLIEQEYPASRVIQIQRQ